MESVTTQHFPKTANNYEGQLGNGEDIPTVVESDNDEERCPYCGEWYSGIGVHWTRSSDCKWPQISQYKTNLLTGLMLGDGSMHTNCGHFECGLVNKTFLQWLSCELGWLVNNLSMQQTAIKSAKNTRETLGRNTQPSDALDYYLLRTRSHPSLQQFIEWYNTGEIVFPTNIELTPTILRMWYISDGGLHWGNKKPIVELNSVNEANRPEAIENMLGCAGFTINHKKGSEHFYIPHCEIDEFFDFMGNEPVPGFEYKWTYEDRERYDKLKDEMRTKHCTQTLNS